MSGREPDRGGSEPTSISRRRLRIVEALALGPVWVRRSAREPLCAGSHARSGSPAVEDQEGRALRISTLVWSAVRDEVSVCNACGLSAARTQTVFGIGAERPECLIVGGPPKADEDASGEPFAAAAARLLDAMLAAVGLSRDRNAFVTNVLKSRLPGDRDPMPGELANCRPFLDRQIALLAPKTILVVGEIATRAVLGAGSVAEWRGKGHPRSIAGRDVIVVATHGVAELIADGSRKAEVWTDLCLARAAWQAVPAG